MKSERTIHFEATELAARKKQKEARKAVVALSVQLRDAQKALVAAEEEWDLTLAELDQARIYDEENE